jgi:hypothetical protein
LLRTGLQGKAVEITNANIAKLERLCAEFGFSEFAAKLSQFSRPSKDSQKQQIGSPLSRMRSAQLREPFLFVVNGAVIESDVAEAAALFGAVREQLSVDGCGRTFILNDSGIESADIRSLEFLLSDETISDGRSQFLQINLLGKVNVDLLFLGCSKCDIRKNHWDFEKESRIDLESVDVSVFSVEVLDSLLLSESISIESEDSLLLFILKLGPDYRDLLRHIQIVFLSESGLSLLEEDLGIPPESLWYVIAERIAHPPSPLDSRIISDFPDRKSVV